MALPTRDSFFETGLAPVSNTSEACSICLTEPMDTPVQVPCKHTFCKPCITKWLETSNSCAMCRTPLFVKVPLRIPLGPDRVRVLHARNAFQASGLLSLANHVDPRGRPLTSEPVSLANVDMFQGFLPGAPAMDVVQLMRSTTRAHQLIIWDRTPTPVGPVVFNSLSLAMNLIAMANLLKHMAAQQGRPYPPRGNPWGQLVSGIWRTLSPDVGKPLDAMIVPGTIMATLSREFAHNLDSRLNVFFANDAAERDMEMLIGMVVDSAQQEHRRNIAHEELMRVARGGVPRENESSRAGERMRDRLSRHTEGRCVVM